MAQVNVDPAELRRFAQDLKRFTDEIESLMGQMHGRMNALEASWRDQEHKKFAEAFQQTTKSLGSFVQLAGEHAVFLSKKAAAVEQYLSHRQALPMFEQVNVNDLEAFAIFRVALHKFAQAADQALSIAEGEIARKQFWLETEQTTHWQAQLRRSGEAVVRAREAVRQKKLFKDSSGRPPSSVEEEKALTKALAVMQHAEEKMHAVKRSLPRLFKANDQFRGGVARLKIDVTIEIPKAIALLDRLSGSLEHYVQLEPAPGAVIEAAPASDSSMSRGQETDAVPPPPIAAGNPPAFPSVPPTAVQPEAPDVVNGQ